MTHGALQYLALLATWSSWPSRCSGCCPRRSRRRGRWPACDPTWIPRHPPWPTSPTRSASRTWSARGAAQPGRGAVASALLTVLLALPAAYALARYRGHARQVAIGWVLVSQVFPFVLIIIPLFMVLRQLDLVNTLRRARGRVRDVRRCRSRCGCCRGTCGRCRASWRRRRRSTARAGCGRSSAWSRRCSRPAWSRPLLFAFISSWNEFFFALVLLKDPDEATLPLTLVRFIGAEGVARLGPLAAASLLATSRAWSSSPSSSAGCGPA